MAKLYSALVRVVTIIDVKSFYTKDVVLKEFSFPFLFSYVTKLNDLDQRVNFFIKIIS